MSLMPTDEDEAYSRGMVDGMMLNRAGYRVEKIVDMLHRTANVCEDGGHKSRAKMLRALAKEMLTALPEERREKIVVRLTHIADQFASQGAGSQKRARMFRMLAEEFKRRNI